ncbi:UDP-2,4-diacetamido-2,4,6-trideoxy-beta-L-altropyranose hydrolase [Hymenobacter setariae]|uniref:UDP-2,4-diacetamido-2,4, 6-trideoxy-beta-L-altropyranose hydrolase n=1 Tax=Hymenobacter setariae TaxID=2594794 RepID=UPI001F3624BC|nr:UDP-2,4-diacetamido-2,4,6-trideoxy-beta-L-altropyranose hydrolase [Hymenobacter setariae]
MSASAVPRLLFRADGNAQIGLGHLMRLLALANQLQGLALGTFLVREPTAAVGQMLAANGWIVQPLPAQQSWLAEADWLAQQVLQPSDVLVLDGYYFGADYQQRLRVSGCSLVYVDDLQAWPVVADVLINHSPGVMATDYQAPTTTDFLLGPAFSLLRQPFLESAALPQWPTAIESALVCFGGADPLRLTVRIIRALQALPQLQRLGVLLGSAFGDAAALEELAATSSGVIITFHRNIEAAPLANLLREHDMAIVPASTVLIEALVLGRPSITGYYVDNQRALASYVHAHQQAFSVGNFAELNDAGLLARLHDGIAWLETTPRQPYVKQLRPDLLRAKVQQLLDRALP